MNPTLSFESVSHLLLIEEREPTPEALARWQEMYPDHREALAEFFVVWAEDLASPVEEVPAIDEAAEAAAIQKLVDYALDVLRKQGRLIPKEYVAAIQPFDQVILEAVIELRGAGYHGNIARRAGEMTGKHVLMGTAYASLLRLEKLKLLEWRCADPVSEPQNTGRQYYMATMAGERSLARAKAAAQPEAGYLGEPA
ncbi:MAG TPA: hypothetical protein VGK48_08165 [Terriglobia bacterium]|jgi:hypothetical protein